MCCGDGPSEAEIAVLPAGNYETGAALTAAIGEVVMAKEKAKAGMVPLFTTSPGSELTIGGFGRATNTRGVLVPEDQVESLTAEGLLSTEPLEEPNTRASRKAARESKER